MIKTRGSTKPDLRITISDAAGVADFSSLTASAIRVIGEMGESVKFDRQATEFTPAQDGKSGIVRLVWVDSDVDAAGRLWVYVKVTWPSSKPQFFPASGPLKIDLIRAPGDD